MLFGPSISSGARPNKDIGDALDSVTHEVGHHALGWSSNLADCAIQCQDAGAALAEGFADFGGIVADLKYGEAVPWNQGDHFLSDSLGVRSASFPIGSNLWSRDYWPQRSLWLTTEGGAHDNATILTHAYYLLVNGGYHSRAGLTGIPFVAVPALGQQKAEEVFFGAVTSAEMSSSQTFFDTRLLTRDIAASQFGQAEALAVSYAWEAVGVTPCSTPPPSPAVWTESLCPWWRVHRSDVPGATTYNTQYAHAPSFAAPATASSGPENACDVQVSLWTYFRARACNACGCSNWSNSVAIFPWTQECP